jgi:hypothetical protein
MKFVTTDPKGESEELAYEHFEGHQLANSLLELSWCEKDGFLHFRMDVDIPKEATYGDVWSFESTLNWAVLTIREKMLEEAKANPLCTCPHWDLKRLRRKD